MKINKQGISNGVNKKSLVISAIIFFIAAVSAAVLSFKNIAPPQEAVKEKIGIGIVNIDKEEIKKYGTLAEYLNKYSGDEWYLVPLKDYSSFISQMELGQIKAGFLGSMIGYRGIKEGLFLPVVRGEKDGVSTYYSYIFSRKDSGIDKIEDLENKKFAYVDISTSAGYLFPVYVLKSKGYDPENFFRVASFVDSHEKAISVVLSGEFDAGAAKDTAWKKMAEENPAVEKEFQILASEGPFPENTFMISADFGGGEAAELRNLLVKMADSEEGKEYLAKIGADRFIATDEKDFDAVKRISIFN